MTQWLKPKSQEGHKRKIQYGNGTYVFFRHNEKGTGVPEDVAKYILKTFPGEFEVMESEWHQKMKQKVDRGLVEEVKKHIPESMENMIDVRLKEKDEPEKKRSFSDLSEKRGRGRPRKS